MNKASPVEMRKALEHVDMFKRAGILFVPIPIIDDADRDALIVESFNRLNSFADDKGNE